MWVWNACKGEKAGTVGGKKETGEQYCAAVETKEGGREKRSAMRDVPSVSDALTAIKGIRRR